MMIKRFLYILITLMVSFTAYAQDTISVRITGNYTFYFDVDEDEGTSDWFFSGKDETGKYEVRLDWPADKEGKYGTYTYKDLDRDYSYIKDYSSGSGISEMEYRNYVEGTTITVSDNAGKLHIEGNLVCDNGVVYKLWMEHQPQTYNIEGTALTEIYYFTEDNDWYLRFNDDRFRVCLDLITGSQSKFSGNYTEADAISDYCFASDLQEGGTDFFSTFKVTLSMPKGIKDPTVACEITGTAVSEHGDTYIFHQKKDPPITPTKSIDVDVNVLEAQWPAKRDDDCKAYFVLQESGTSDPSDTASPYQWHLGVTALTGTFSEESIIDSLSYRLNTVTGEKLKLDNGTLSLYVESDPVTLKGQASLVMKDSIQYNISFSSPIQTKGSRAFDFSNLALNDNSYSSVGYQWLTFSNDSASVEVELQNDVPGEYDDSNMSVSMAVRGTDGLMSAVKSIAVINGSTVLDAHNQPVFKSLILGDDRRVYSLNAHLDIPAIKDTMDITVSGMKVHDYTESMGVFQIMGYNSDSTVYVALAPATTQLEGHYDTASLTTYNSYSFLAMKQSDGTYKKMPFYTADFDVTVSDSPAEEGDTVYVTGQFQCEAHLLRLALKGTIRPQGIDYDSEDKDLDVTFYAGDLATLEKGSGYGYVEFQNTSRSDIFSLLVYLDQFDDDIVIPEGTYEVNTTYSAPSVQPGQMSSTGLYPTFYATLGSDGYLYTPFWFLTEGTVTVTKTADRNLKLVVNGKNSYGRTIHVTYDGTGSAIANVTAERSSSKAVYKLLDNDQIIIRKSTGKFCMSGQRIE